jgi:hypothetical protein
LLHHLLLLKGSRARQHWETLHGGNNLQAAAAAAAAAVARKYQAISSASQLSNTTHKQGAMQHQDTQYQITLIWP